MTRANEAQLRLLETIEARMRDSYETRAEAQTRLLETIEARMRDAYETRAAAQDARLTGFGEAADIRASQTQRALTDGLAQMEGRLNSFDESTKRSLGEIREEVSRRLADIQADNGQKLDQMRAVVDEKLQKTLSERMNESFKLINERLQQVHVALGEMQTLAQGVGDLKKVLGNVKTRGVLGEVQLGAILSDILTPDQYDVNVATKKNSACRVEFAVKLPADDGSRIYLPIDAKFPGDAYASLRDAYDSGDPARIDACAAALLATIRQEARDISTKYIDPPNTTDFAILFLPFEGLYSEVVNRGMVEKLQHEFRVNVAGPSTMAALLNSLQMSFRSVAIQKRSDEVWRVLGAVKTEFDRFAAALEATQKKLKQADDELDKLVGTRTRQLRRSLNNVTRLEEPEAARVLRLEETLFDGGDEG